LLEIFKKIKIKIKNMWLSKKLEGQLKETFQILVSENFQRVKSNIKVYKRFSWWRFYGMVEIAVLKTPPSM
jgi:hypothetical protein